MKKNGFIVFLLLVVIAAAVLSVWLFFLRDSAAPEQTPPPGTAPEWTLLPLRTPGPAPARSPEPEPEETPTPEPEETPEPGPDPTPTPTPTPTPHPVDASGSFASDTGTGLNLLADWAVYTDAAGNRKLDVTFSARHYALRTAASYQALALTVNGKSYSSDCPAIAYDGGESAVTPLHTFTLDAPSGSVDMTAVWNFKGSYSGKDLEKITASGTAYIG